MIGSKKLQIPDEEFTLEYDNLNKKYIEEWKATGKELQTW